MKVLIVGGGGREHSLGWKLAQSENVTDIFFAPGNGGTEEIGRNVQILPNEIKKLAKFAQKHSIDLTIVGVDNALAEGIVDEFRAHGLRIFGPDKYAAQIESSKSFAKKMMHRLSIPTAEFNVFHNYEKALTYLDQQKFPIVMKVSGLALGKGVSICNTLEEAREWCRKVMLEKQFGESGETIIIEEFLEGYELSVHAICDGKSFELFPTSQDNKSIYDHGKGPNTGGMGVATPIESLTRKDLEFITQSIVKPIIDEFARLGHPFVGCLYPGLMITEDGIKVIEYNARFGDPECQAYMRILESDLFELLYACTEGKLNQRSLKWKQGKSVCVVLASEGYPGKTIINKQISGLNQNVSDTVVFHAATKKVGNKIVTSGGRVLNVACSAKTFVEAKNKAYKRVESIHFDGMQYRKDIGEPKTTLKNIVNNH